jgi:hypothetical protein
MTLTQRLTEIMMKVWMESCDSKNPHKTIDTALSAILTAIRKDVEGLKVKISPARGIDHSDCQCDHIYNQAIDDVLEKLK